MIKTITNDFNDSEEDFLEDDDRLKISTYNQLENSKFNKFSEERYELLHKILEKEIFIIQNLKVMEIKLM